MPGTGDHDESEWVIRFERNQRSGWSGILSRFRSVEIQASPQRDRQRIGARGLGSNLSSPRDCLRAVSECEVPPATHAPPHRVRGQCRCLAQRQSSRCLGAGSQSHRHGCHARVRTYAYAIVRRLTCIAIADHRSALASRMPSLQTRAWRVRSGLCSLLTTNRCSAALR